MHFSKVRKIKDYSFLQVNSAVHIHLSTGYSHHTRLVPIPCPILQIIYIQRQEKGNRDLES